MHHPQCTGTTANHAPLLAAQSPGVDLLQQSPQAHWTGTWACLDGFHAKTALQQFQDLGLFVKGVTGPESCLQGIGFGFVQFLFLRGG